jgi:hypothetical protein
VISIDGMKLRANASRGANRTYEKLVADILKAEETNRWEGGLFGADRGDEVPEQLRTEEGRRAALAAAKERLAKKAGRRKESEVDPIEAVHQPAPRRIHLRKVFTELGVTSRTQLSSALFDRANQTRTA